MVHVNCNTSIYLQVSVEVEKLMLSQENEELLCDRAPSHFLDPILGMIMNINKNL